MIWLPCTKRAEGENLPVAQNHYELLLAVLRHPAVAAEARAFREQAVRVLPAPAEGWGPGAGAAPKLLYVAQREQATALPNKVEVMGTDEMTTCMGVVLRNPSNCRTAVGHLDSVSCVARGLDSMLASLHAQPSTRIEVHLTGSFEDWGHPQGESEQQPADQSEGRAAPLAKANGRHQSHSHASASASANGVHRNPTAGQFGGQGQGEAGKDVPEEVWWEPLECSVAEWRRPKGGAPGVPALRGYSWPLGLAVIRHLQQSPTSLALRTCCILSHNTRKSEQGTARPLVRGIAVEPGSGRVVPARFTPQARGPDQALRAVCAMAAPCSRSRRRRGGTLLQVYHTESDSFRIGPCRYLNAELWARGLLGLSDGDLLNAFSTSPEAESDDFIPSSRGYLEYLKNNPHWRDVFPGGMSRRFVRDVFGEWMHQ